MKDSQNASNAFRNGLALGYSQPLPGATGNRYGPPNHTGLPTHAFPSTSRLQDQTRGYHPSQQPQTITGPLPLPFDPRFGVPVNTSDNRCIGWSHEQPTQLGLLDSGSVNCSGSIPVPIAPNNTVDSVIQHLQQLDARTAELNSNVQSLEKCVVLQNQALTALSDQMVLLQGMVEDIKVSRDKRSAIGSNSDLSEMCCTVEALLNKIPGYHCDGDNKYPPRILVAQVMKCSDSGCPSNESGSEKPCVSAPYYGLSLLNRPPGRKKSSVKSGTLLGLKIIEGFKGVSGNHFPFFPNTLETFNYIFLPATGNAILHIDENARFGSAEFSDTHIHALFDYNQSQITAEIRSFLTTTRGSRKRDLVTAFSKYPQSHLEYTSPSPDWYLRKEDIDGGAYRKTDTSPVDDARFVSSVRSAFSIDATCRQITLSQLAFAGISLIREYVEEAVAPSLYKIVPSSHDVRNKTETQTARHAIMCGSLALQLDEMSSRTSTGWNTIAFDVINDFITSKMSVLVAEQEKLGSRRV